MKTIEAKFKIVTPMFLHGADQTKAEIRVSSIKGMLRFWWRALNYDDNISKVWEKDAYIFGGSDQKIGKSKVMFTLTENNTSTKIAEKWSTNEWKSYIGYGLTNKKTKNSELEKTECLEPGGEFKIRIDIDEKQDGNKNIIAYDEVVKVLKVFGLLGGLGSRSRRGWGSISIVELKTDNHTSWEIPHKEDKYTYELKKLLGNSKNNASLPPEYTAFYSGTRIVISKNPFPTYESAFKEIAEEYKNYDKKNEGFGSPRKNSNGRRASPLFIHIHQIDNNQYLWVCIFFKSKFNESSDMPSDDYKNVEDFIAKLINDGNTEVKL